jgi:hypothetical protein
MIELDTVDAHLADAAILHNCVVMLRCTRLKYMIYISHHCKNYVTDQDTKLLGRYVIRTGYGQQSKSWLDDKDTKGGQIGTAL